MGNEPSFGVPWEYDYVGVPFETQEVVREIQDQDFTDSPTGLAGNDDLGEMSSWYVWSALGAYPENPGSSEVVLGSPLFKDIVVHLGDGGTITENAPDAADDAPYVQRLTVDGTSWTGPTSVPVSSPRADIGLDARHLAQHHVGRCSRGFTTVEHRGAASRARVRVRQRWRECRGPRIERGRLAGRPEHVRSSPSTSAGARWRNPAPNRRGARCGTLTVESESQSAEPIRLHVPATTPAGTYTVTFALHTADGTALPDVVTEVEVP